VVRVVRRVGIIQETERVRQKRPDERVAACAVRLDDVSGQHGRGDAVARRVGMQRGLPRLSSRARERRKNGTGGGWYRGGHSTEAKRRG